MIGANAVLELIDHAPAFVDAVEDPAAIAEAIRQFGLAELTDAMKILRAAEGEARGLMLSASAQRLGQLVAAGALHEGFAKASIEEAASSCLLIRDDGLKAVRAAITAGIKLGKKQPRDLSHAGRAAIGQRRANIVPPASDHIEAASDAPAEPLPIEGKDDGKPPGPSGFDLAEINRSYALAIWGGKAVVVNEQPHGPVNDRVRLMSFDSMNSWFANRHTEIRGADGKKKNVTWATAWHKHPNRRQYAGVEFFPNPDGTPSTPNYLNLWRGFSVVPSDAGNCGKFKDHLRVNVCQEDERLFRYLFGWLAHMVQRPRDRAGIALILRGPSRTVTARAHRAFLAVASAIERVEFKYNELAIAVAKDGPGASEAFVKQYLFEVRNALADAWQAATERGERPPAGQAEPHDSSPNWGDLFGYAEANAEAREDGNRR
jgi:hypothetical protein